MAEECKGDVVMAASEECLKGLGERLRGKEPDFTVTAASLQEATDQYVCIAWETRGAGFGTLTFYREGGRLKVDTEAMGREFCQEVLTKLLDQALANSD